MDALKMTENDIRNACAEYLLYQGYLVLRVNSGAAIVTENGKRRFINYVKWFIRGDAPQTAGVSDLLAIHPDPTFKPLAVECKRPGNTPTDAQKRFIAAWEKHGGVAIVAESVTDVERVLSQ